MTRLVAWFALVAAAGCATPAHLPQTVVIPKAPAATAAFESERAVERDPDRDALLGTWQETLVGHQCNDITTVRVRDGELAVSAKACTGSAVYVTQSVRYENGELELSFREATSGALFRYHLTQTSRRKLTGELEIADGEPRVFPVTWTKPR